MLFDRKISAASFSSNGGGHPDSFSDPIPDLGRGQPAAEIGRRLIPAQ
jgi:hypothetical protein